MAVIKQWVNLPKEAKFVGDGITSKNRLDFLHFETKFKNANPALYKVKIIPMGSGNIKYSKKEQKRHKGFNLQKQPPQLSAKKKDVVEQDVYLPAAGGNQYKIKARYGKKVVESKTIVEVWRRLYYQVISMKGVPCLSSMSKFEDAFEDKKNKYFIELKEQGNGRNRMKFMKTVYDKNYTILTGNGDEFRKQARAVYSIRKYEPYSVAVVFSNNIADPREFKIIDTVSREIPSKLFRWGSYNDECTLDVADSSGNDEYLWLGLNDEHDKKKAWLVSAVFETKDKRKLKISSDDISFTGAKGYDKGGYSKLKINLKGVKRKFFSKIEGKIKVTVLVVDGFSGGFSYNSLNLITVATRAWWGKKPTTDVEMLQILNHEMGHKVGMVAYGDKKHPKNPKFTYKPMLPDAPKTLYGENRGINNQEHLGPHCSKDVKYRNATKKASAEWSGKPGCVMFGATAVYDSKTKSYNSPPATFCSECKPAVRKLDLNGRNLPGLKNRF